MNSTYLLRVIPLLFVTFPLLYIFIACVNIATGVMTACANIATGVMIACVSIATRVMIACVNIATGVMSSSTAII
jgi:hypothetical protein